ncbi:MAG: orotidine-5'-phosphate decarboxylase [Candidatus Marinimicrobia bacterium]|nr:orotidine-5'-phosphate decarboxylase [Candidatus Neomarinimicrobiota bacterium]
MDYLEKLKNSNRSKGNYLCVGVDPDPEKIPSRFEKSATGIHAFCKELINVTHDITPAYKFNLAFFEIWGSKGWSILESLINQIPDDIFIIGDAKRGDIGNSSKFYAQALLKNLDFDAVTINPYLGSESITPFIQQAEKGVFVLCVTSNPSGRELQDHGEPMLYIKTAQICQKLNQKNNVGLVMGATKPEQLLEVRKNFPEMPFLIPGVGSQGGAVDAAVQVCNAIEAGVINVSRGISYAQGDFPDNIRKSAEKYTELFKK